MKKVRELHSLKTPESPWKEISINIIGPLLKSNEKDMIIVIVNQFTKMKYENYMGSQELFSVIEDLNLHQGL